MNTLIAVSTYKKNKALRVVLQSILDNKMNIDNQVVITDDDKPTAEEVFLEFKDKMPELSYSGGKSASIAINKNRGIRFFLEKTKCDYLLLSDDDIEFINPGIVEELIKAYKESNYSHLTTYLGGDLNHIDVKNSSNLIKNSFFNQFPPISEDENVYWCKGSQGICSFFTRDITLKVGYYTKFPYRYGYEHSEYSARCNKAQGYNPELTGILKRSPKYFKTQEVPNDYDVDINLVQQKNGKVYYEQLKRIYQGYGLNSSKHFL